jgi:hypothetical protein
VESPALENPKVETLNWTVSLKWLIQSKVSTFGFSNAGLSTFKILIFLGPKVYGIFPIKLASRSYCLHFPPQLKP